ncbi:MAG: hypothetical protein KF842_13430 [Caulobacter sp.]|nr:hypothetical protein [Caulobacter sp.]
MREPLLSKTRTRTDRKLVRRFAWPYLIFAVALATLTIGGNLLPPVWQRYVLPPVMIVLFVVFYAVVQAPGRLVQPVDTVRRRGARAGAAGQNSWRRQLERVPISGNRLSDKTRDQQKPSAGR